MPPLVDTILKVLGTVLPFGRSMLRWITPPLKVEVTYFCCQEVHDQVTAYPRCYFAELFVTERLGAPAYIRAVFVVAGGRTYEQDGGEMVPFAPGEPKELWIIFPVADDDEETLQSSRFKLVLVPVKGRRAKASAISPF
jgi:hypothetical protein